MLNIVYLECLISMSSVGTFKFEEIKIEDFAIEDPEIQNQKFWLESSCIVKRSRSDSWSGSFVYPQIDFFLQQLYTERSGCVFMPLLGIGI